MHEFLKDAAAMLIILELIEAGAGRGKQHDFAGLRLRGGSLNGASQGFTGMHRHGAAKL